MAISWRRVAPWASSRLATLAQAMSSTSTTAHWRMSSTGRTFPITVSASGTATALRPAKSFG